MKDEGKCTLNPELVTTLRVVTHWTDAPRPRCYGIAERPSVRSHASVGTR